MSKDDTSESPEPPSTSAPDETARPLDTTLPSATGATAGDAEDQPRQGPGNTLVMEDGGPSEFVKEAKRTLVSEEGPSEPARPPAGGSST